MERVARSAACRAGTSTGSGTAVHANTEFKSKHYKININIMKKTNGERVHFMAGMGPENGRSGAPCTGLLVSTARSSHGPTCTRRGRSGCRPPTHPADACRGRKVFKRSLQAFGRAKGLSTSKQWTKTNLVQLLRVGPQENSLSLLSVAAHRYCYITGHPLLGRPRGDGRRDIWWKVTRVTRVREYLRQSPAYTFPLE